MHPSKRPIFHLLPNAHLDPVWLWDWREGLTEGVTTVQTILDLMDEDPELTFMRGEQVIYQHIQRTAPALFKRIQKRIEEGRWDVVGGTYVQPDSNLGSVEMLCRQFERSLQYFEKELGVRPSISWQADSFGHTAGWPNILRSFGMEGFAFTRPQRKQFPMDSPAFWWHCDHDDRLLCYRQHWQWYCSERFNLLHVLDETLRGAATQPFRNVGVLMGLGNHGGGPTRRHLAEVRKWRETHADVEVRYSTLTGFFKALRRELATLPEGSAPSKGGELGFCLRGCYSSVQKFKSLYRQAESAVVDAEIADSVIDSDSPQGALNEAWESVLFNSFHDILPGSSIERAMEEQMAWTGLAIHHSRKVQFSALNRLAEQIDTRVAKPRDTDAPAPVPLMIWNPLPRIYRGPVEIETSLDYRPIFEYQHRAGDLPFQLRDAKGKTMPCQEIVTEHGSMTDVPWRKRVVAPVTIPAFGWKIVHMGLATKKPKSAPRDSACRAGGTRSPWIANPDWKVEAGELLTIKKGGVAFLGTGIRFLVVEDPWGSWGGMDEEPEGYCLREVREEWKLSQKVILESGPERSRLWTRWQGPHSWVELTFDVCRDLPWVCVQGRMLWNERSARLQMVLPSVGPATCDVPGSVVMRETTGQVPVARWFLRSNKQGATVGIATDVLSDVEFQKKETRLTLARASRYANDVRTKPEDKLWQPATDCGELKFRLALFTDGIQPDHVADGLIHPPEVRLVTPSPGALPHEGSLGSLTPNYVRLLSLQRTETGLSIRVQNRSKRPAHAKFVHQGKTHSLGTICPQQIVTVDLASR